MADTGGTIKGVIIGGVIGAVTALLLAPKSGRELRSDICDRYSTVQDRTKQLLSDATSKTQEIAKQVGQQASDMADKTRSALTAAKDEVQSWKEEKMDAKT